MVRAGACSPSSAPSLNALEIVSAIREGLEVGVSTTKPSSSSIPCDGGDRRRSETCLGETLSVTRLKQSQAKKHLFPRGVTVP